MYSNDQNHGKTGNVTVYAQVSRSKTDFLRNTDRIAAGLRQFYT